MLLSRASLPELIFKRAISTVSLLGVIARSERASELAAGAKFIGGAPNGKIKRTEVRSQYSISRLINSPCIRFDDSTGIKASTL